MKPPALAAPLSFTKKGKRYVAKTKVLDQACCHVLNMVKFFSEMGRNFERKNDGAPPNSNLRAAVHETVNYFLEEGHVDLLETFQKFPFEEKGIDFVENMSMNEEDLVDDQMARSKKNFTELAKAVQGSCTHCKGFLSIVQQSLSIIYDTGNASLDKFVYGAAWNCCPAAVSRAQKNKESRPSMENPDDENVSSATISLPEEINEKRKDFLQQTLASLKPGACMPFKSY